MKKVKLGDIAKEYGSGMTPLRSNQSFWNSNDVPWLKTEQVGEYHIYNSNEYISQTAFDETNIKLFPAHTIIIAMYGEGKTRGNVSILMKPMTTNQACCNIIVDENKADYRFVYYAIKNNYLNLRSLSSGVRKNLNSNDVMNFPIPDLDKTKQLSIANVLSKIDDKIELNNKINAELESMAKTIYDYWFTQFDFPDENGRPYKSSGGKMEWNEELQREIPVGWEVKKVKDLTIVLTGKEDANFSTQNGKYKFFTCSTETLLCDVPAFNGSAILVTGNGDFNVKHFTGEFNAYQRTYVLIPENKRFYASMYIAAQKNIEKFKNGSNGSIIKFITKRDVESITIFEPHNDSLLQQLNQILQQIENNQIESEKLTSLRDWLLPMLMNGQIEMTL